MGLKPSMGDSSLGDAVETHSPNQILSHQQLNYGDFLYVKKRGIPRRLARVIGVDFLSEKIMVEWIVGLTLLTAGLEFSEHSLNGHRGENWLEKASGVIKINAYWVQRSLAKPFDPDKIDPDYFP